jgi:X-X-X-Leu-X-X-Gly heptad repeat protein
MGACGPRRLWTAQALLGGVAASAIAGCSLDEQGIACGSLCVDGGTDVTAERTADATRDVTAKDASDGAREASDAGRDVSGGPSDASDGASEAADGASDAADGASEAADAAPHCITFEACVDGSDYVKVVGSTLTIVHGDYDLMGEHPDCAMFHSAVNGAVSLYDSTNGRFVIDGVPYPLSAVPLAVGILDLASFKAVIGRGPVTLSGSNQILIDDDSFSGPGAYEVDLCD